MQLHELPMNDRRRLLRFVCSFAWADLEVVAAERAMLKTIIEQMGLDPQEAAEAQQWLARPPEPDTIDPQEIPVEHRQIFLDTAMKMVLADGQIADGEAENYALLKQLLSD